LLNIHLQPGAVDQRILWNYVFKRKVEQQTLCIIAIMTNLKQGFTAMGGCRMGRLDPGILVSIDKVNPLTS
jgi:hypothetical protein